MNVVRTVASGIGLTLALALALLPLAAPTIVIYWLIDMSGPLALVLDCVATAIVGSFYLLLAFLAD